MNNSSSICHAPSRRSRIMARLLVALLLCSLLSSSLPAAPVAATSNLARTPAVRSALLARQQQFAQPIVSEVASSRATCRPITTTGRTMYWPLVLTSGVPAAKAKSIAAPQPAMTNPVDIAPPLDLTVATDFAEAARFLYTGANPIQVGVDETTIDSRYVAIIRGCVRDRNDNPLSGVRVRIHNHPEFGETISGGDGQFNMVVNGGATLVVDFQRPGLLPAQRIVDVPWRDYAWIDDVALIPLDGTVTTLDLNANMPMQVARDSLVSDADGNRQATLLVPRGTQAEMLLADGSTVPLSRVSIRATEYTVGPNGPAAMPATLPPQSGYTYALEYSIDEALGFGAGEARFSEVIEVKFSQNLYHYNENFLNLPVGTVVPSGYYDRLQTQWKPSDDGRVVQIVSITNSLANLDTDGDGVADNDPTLGITTDERQQLAQIYQAEGSIQVGTSLWRVPIDHFTPWDYNWPYGPGPDDRPPSSDLPLPTVELREDCADQQRGSIIECQNQTLGETVDLIGTSLKLHYRSDRMRGRSVARALNIPLSGASLPSSLKRITLEISIAGQRIVQEFDPQPNQTHRFTWDGRDGYGRVVQGQFPIQVRLGYVYDGVYQSPRDFERSFAQFSGVPITGSRTRQEVTLWREWKGTLGGWDTQAQGLGGWSLSAHHIYDSVGRVLYQGDGQRRSVQSIPPEIRTIAGTGNTTFNGDGGLAINANLFNPWDVAFGRDGSVYIADAYNHRIRRVAPDGRISTVVGTGVEGFSGDGGPATQAQISRNATQIEVGPDGSLYIDDGARVRRVTPDGIIRTIAGTGVPGNSGDGGLATSATLSATTTIAAPDNSLYIADAEHHVVRYVNPEGIITRIAGTGNAEFSGDGGPAAAAELSGPSDIRLGPDGSLYIADARNNRIRRIDPAGIITTIAGGGNRSGTAADGFPATEAELDISTGTDIDVGPDGSIYVSERSNFRLRRIDPQGIITTVIGSGQQGFAGDGGPPTQALIGTVRSVRIAPDGSLYIADRGNHRIRRVALTLPGYTAREIDIPSSDGTLLYRFNAQGRHLRTIDTRTGGIVSTFSYDSQGRLIGISDGDGNRTSIERDGSGNATALVSPFGQRTTLTLNSNGFLASISNPAGETLQFGYSEAGLLTSMTDARGSVAQYSYDADGRLINATDRAGNASTLSRTGSNSSYSVVFRDALGRETTYRVDQRSAGDRGLVTAFANGTQRASTRRPNGTQVSLLPNQMGISTTDGGDPRFGMLAPVQASQIITTPGGLQFETTRQISATLFNPTSPLSLTEIIDQISVNGRRYTNNYDANSRQFTLTTPAGRSIRTAIDGQGRVTQEDVTGFDPLNYSYDTRGRLSSATQGGGAAARNFNLTYNANGFLAQITDPLGQTTGFAYDAAGRVTQQTLADGRVISYSYDANGNLSSITPPGGSAHSFSYTTRDEVSSYTPPALGSGSPATQYSYDAAGQLTQISRPDGQNISFTYTNVGRINSLTTPRGTTNYSYNATSGNLSSITAPDNVGLNYTYDGLLLRDETWSGPVVGTVSRSYDNNFRITATSINGGNSISFTYDNDSLLIGAGDLNLIRNSAHGLITGSNLGNVNDTWSYSSFAEPISYRASYSGTTLYNVMYSHDGLGRIVEKAETIGGTTTTYAYVYDQAGRLVEVRRNGSPLEQYSYDSNGNRSSVTINGVTSSASYDAQDRLVSYGNASYSYNANGDLMGRSSGGQSTSYNYDAQGNLMGVTLPNGTQISYLVDGQNRRIGRLVNGVLERAWLYADGRNPIAELDGSGNLRSRFVYASRANVPDYFVHSGVTYRIISDQLGSPRLVVNTSTGDIAQRIDYDAFGNVVQDTNPGFQPFGFAGGLYDAATGLVRLGARDYDPQVGRWTTKDPLGFASGDTNLYAYIGGDPVNGVAPGGLWMRKLNFGLVRPSNLVVGNLRWSNRIQRENPFELSQRIGVQQDRLRSDESSTSSECSSQDPTDSEPSGRSNPTTPDPPTPDPPEDLR